MRRESRANRERTRRCDPGPERSGSTPLSGNCHCAAFAEREGRQGRESQKTCMEVSRTVFGVKILCGLVTC
jgi:hypothetical protein